VEQFIVSPIRRYYELELPKVRDRRKCPLLIAMHGYEGDKDSMLQLAREIANANMVVVSLQGPNQFFVAQSAPMKRRVGFGWGTTWKMDESIELHHSNVKDLIGLSVRQYQVDRERVFLLAFSQACSYNYRFAFSYPDEIWGVIAVCGGIPGDWDDNPAYRPSRTHILHIAATQDEWYTREANLTFKEKLAQRAASLDFRFYDSSHKFPRASIPHIQQWLEQHL
jgi:phospholipase/carboxylesterase